MQVPEVDTAVRSLAITWDGSLLAAASDTGACYIWLLHSDVQCVARFEPVHNIQAHGRYIFKCLFTPPAAQPIRYLAAAASDNTVKLWNINDFTLKHTLIVHDRWVWYCAFSSDGTRLATVSSDRMARKWAAPTWETVHVYEGHKNAVKCCAIID